MGAEFNFEILKATNAVDVLAEAGGIIEHAKYEHGHGGYSGSFAEARGAQLLPDEFPDLAAAENWLSDNCQKWEAAFIVQVVNGPYVMGAWCSS